jgi:alpha-glucoside transport system permease protein
VISGRLFPGGTSVKIKQVFAQVVQSRGVCGGKEAEVGDAQIFDEEDGKPDGTLTVGRDGSLPPGAQPAYEKDKGIRIFYVAETPPVHSSTQNYERWNSEGVGQAFLNTFKVTIPGTFIPILIAAFAAYAFSWMNFPGRKVAVHRRCRPAWWCRCRCR